MSLRGLRCQKGKISGLDSSLKLNSKALWSAWRFDIPPWFFILNWLWEGFSEDRLVANDTLNISALKEVVRNAKSLYLNSGYNVSV